MNPNRTTPAAVTVSVNGVAHHVELGTSVATLLVQLGHAPRSVAVAVDAVFVPRALHAGHLLRGGEHITCFQPIVGG
jgi:sulfur carrier protein